MNEPWETTARYGRADLTRHPLIREAYKVACLIERCGASPELTAASSAAFDLCETLSEQMNVLLAERDAAQLVSKKRLELLVNHGVLDGDGITDEDLSDEDESL